MDLDPLEVEQVLPSRDIFPAAMPRYPNLWFFVDKRVVLRGQYRYAVEYVVKTLEQELWFRDDFITGIENHFVYHLLGPPSEGADFQMRIGPFHSYTERAVPERSHRHQIHPRFYLTSLLNSGAYQVSLPSLPNRHYLVLAASVHYEVATEDPSHPYVDVCPLCGITGDYNVPIQPNSEDYCIRIHDPLGIEFMLYGTVRGELYPEDRPRPCLSLSQVSDAVSDACWEVVALAPKHLEPVKLGCVFVGPQE